MSAPMVANPRSDEGPFGGCEEVRRHALASAPLRDDKVVNPGHGSVRANEVIHLRGGAPTEAVMQPPHQPEQVPRGEPVLSREYQPHLPGQSPGPRGFPREVRVYHPSRIPDYRRVASGHEHHRGPGPQIGAQFLAMERREPARLRVPRGLVEGRRARAGRAAKQPRR